MTDSDIPSMQTLAPIVDQLREIARSELSEPQALKIALWDDGDYDIRVYHQMGFDTREQILYDNETWEVRYQYWKGVQWHSEFVSEEEGTVRTATFEETEDRVLTTIEPPGT